MEQADRDLDHHRHLNPLVEALRGESGRVADDGGYRVQRHTTLLRPYLLAASMCPSNEGVAELTEPDGLQDLAVGVLVDLLDCAFHHFADERIYRRRASSLKALGRRERLGINALNVHAATLVDELDRAGDLTLPVNSLHFACTTRQSLDLCRVHAALRVQHQHIANTSRTHWRSTLRPVPFQPYLFDFQPSIAE